ncbi:unnamed protein product [Pieris macdunnoughi]|uniref:Mos1 transposase HTH domain-containing protein n=2 Tax=Pieris macdunnoughi TaxID=345717 RepID=A0A821QTE0_9NEOP|nr:unnamed protein product [Pieris macdunnoughi]
MEKNEIRAVIKYFCLKKMSTKDIHSDLVETLGDSAPPYSTVDLETSLFPTPKKFKVSSSAGKVMASVFWDAEGIIMVEYLEKGATIIVSYYADQIRRLREAIKQKRRGKLRAGVLFHQDNAPSHKAAVAMAAIQETGFELLEHPPYSPDLAPSDFYLFPRLKEYLRGKKFDDDSEVMTAVEVFCEGQDNEFFSKGIMGLEKRWTKCIDSLGDYVEK